MQRSNPALRPSLELLRPAPLKYWREKGTPNSVVQKGCTSTSNKSRSGRCSRMSSCRGGRVLSHIISPPFPPTSLPPCIWPPLPLPSPPPNPLSLHQPNFSAYFNDFVFEHPVDPNGVVMLEVLRTDSLELRLFQVPPARPVRPGPRYTRPLLVPPLSEGCKSLPDGVARRRSLLLKM